MRPVTDSGDDVEPAPRALVPAAPADLVTLDDEFGPPSDEAFGLPTLRRLLVDTGVDEATVERAEEAGVLGFFAIERFAVPAPARYALDEVAAVTGMPAKQITLMWRSLGLPEPRPGVRIFTEVD